MADLTKKEFKAESKRLLDLMINSIYTNREIFLRELVSNASDAIDKLYFTALSEGITGVSRDDFFINIDVDKENRLLTVEDNGCGMTDKEMEENLGIIAKSGSGAFKRGLKDSDKAKVKEIDIIGQFGVGFYSAFMVSDHVTVISKAFDSQGKSEAFKWQSSGADGYTIEKTEKDNNGTKIIMKIKENTENEKYDEFLDSFKLRSLVKKYSDYIRHPIKMEEEKTRIKEGTEDEYETYTEIETVNSMVPLWRRNKTELADEDYNIFYRDKFFDFMPPAKAIHSNAEGAVTYNALLFIPAKASFDYHTRDFEKGLQLYANGVLIMEKCADLLPDHYSFVKGLVDSPDLSLNISREILQQDRQLKTIASRIEKTINRELKIMLRSDREKFEEFFGNFGVQLKFGVYNEFGKNKDELKDLILFYSSTEKKLVTLAEYVSRMKYDQKYIYYATGENVDKIDMLPQTELVKDKKYEILYLTDDVDEFAFKILNEYDEKEFKSVSSGDLGFEKKEEKQEETKEVKELFDFMTEFLKGKVKDVRGSTRLRTHPVCLSSDGEISLEMEKVFSNMPTEQEVKAERILEINESHKVFRKLQKLYENEEKNKVQEYTELLYTQALLIEGIAIEDPVSFSNTLSNLMAEE